MKQQELTKEEKATINGGGDSFSSGTGLTIGTDSLLALNHTWSSGDKRSSHTLEVGKGINIDLGGNADRAEGN